MEPTKQKAHRDIVNNSSFLIRNSKLSVPMTAGIRVCDIDMTELNRI